MHFGVKKKAITPNSKAGKTNLWCRSHPIRLEEDRDSAFGGEGSEAVVMFFTCVLVIW